MANKPRRGNVKCNSGQHSEKRIPRNSRADLRQEALPGRPLYNSVPFSSVRDLRLM